MLGFKRTRFLHFFGAAIAACVLLPFGAGCAVPDADTAALPAVGSGDTAEVAVGRLSVEKLGTFVAMVPSMASETIDVHGRFYSFDLSDIPDPFNIDDPDQDAGDMMEVVDYETIDLGVCTVATMTLRTMSVDPSFVPIDGTGIEDLPDLAVELDPGNPGLARSGDVSVELQWEEGYSYPPSATSEVGWYYPVPPHVDLFELGFDVGKIVTIEFPGGEDIGAFTASVDVPSDVDVTKPDPMAAEFPVTPGVALPVEWVAGNPDDFLVVVISGIAKTTNLPGGVEQSSVVVHCKFPDDGADEIPGEATSYIPVDGEMNMFMASRYWFGEVEVPMVGDGGSGTVALDARVGIYIVWNNSMDMLLDDYMYLFIDTEDDCVMAGGIWNADTETCEAPPDQEEDLWDGDADFLIDYMYGLFDTEDNCVMADGIWNADTETCEAPTP